MSSSWQRARMWIVRLALRYPALMGALMFLFLHTLSNQIYYTASHIIAMPSYWLMLLMGALMAAFGAVLLYEVIRLTRRLAELEIVRAVANTLLHEINNPLQVIQMSAEKLRTLPQHDPETVGNILTYAERIRVTVADMSKMRERVFLHQESGFAGLIDLDRSQ